MTKPTRDYIIAQAKLENASISLFLRKLVALHYQHRT
jgi:hypothetical protein